jgi:hypothetical protein
VLDTDRKRTSKKCSKNGGDSGTGIYMWEGTTSRVMAANKPYGEFHDFYSISLEYFGYHYVWIKYVNFRYTFMCIYYNNKNSIEGYEFYRCNPFYYY